MKNNILKQISLFGAGLLLSANMNAQTLHGTVKLASDGITPVENAEITIWHQYTTGSASDTLHLTTDANGEYSFAPFKINGDPDTTITNVPEVELKTIENLIITNNPGQGHQFIFSSESKPKGAGEIYNLKGQKVAELEVKYDNETIMSSWNGETNQGLASEGVYIYSQSLENGERKVNKFVQINNGKQSNYSLEKIIENKKTTPVEKSVQNLDQATYLFQLHSIAGTTSPSFTDKIDTIVFAPINGITDFYADHLVDGVPNHRDVSVIIREDYDTLRLENVMVKMRDYNTGLIVDSALTDANGVAVMENVPLGTVFKLEYGNEVSLNNRPDYFSRIDDLTIDSITGTNLVFADTVESVVRQRTLPKKWLTVPKRAGETGTADSVNIGGNSNWLTEIITDSVNIEAAKGRDINIYVDPQSYESYFDDEYVNYGDSLFFPTNADEPWNYISSPINITSTMETNYDENTNFYPGQLGVTIDQATADYVDQKEGTLNDGKTGIIGSKTNIELGTHNTDFFQTNFFAKQFGLYRDNLPSGRNSVFDGTDDPNLIDRALFWTVYKHKQNIYKNEIDTEDYRNVQENL